MCQTLILAIRSCLAESLKQPPMDNKAFRTYFSAQIPRFKNFHVVVDDVFEDVAGNRVAIWCSSTADTAIGPYRNEYVLMFYFNKDGTKVIRIREFVDSASSKYFFTKMDQWLNDNGGSSQDSLQKSSKLPTGNL